MKKTAILAAMIFLVVSLTGCDVIMEIVYEFVPVPETGSVPVTVTVDIQRHRGEMIENHYLYWDEVSWTHTAEGYYSPIAKRWSSQDDSHTGSIRGEAFCYSDCGSEYNFVFDWNSNLTFDEKEPPVIQVRFEDDKVMVICGPGYVSYFFPGTPECYCTPDWQTPEADVTTKVTLLMDDAKRPPGYEDSYLGIITQGIVILTVDPDEFAEGINISDSLYYDDSNINEEGTGTENILTINFTVKSGS